MKYLGLLTILPCDFSFNRNHIKNPVTKDEGLWKVLEAYDDQYSQTVRQRGWLTFSDFPYFLSRKNELSSTRSDSIQNGC